MTMTNATHADKLKALGYDTSPAEIRRFQKDFNRMGPVRLIAVTGTIDGETDSALDMAHVSRAVFVLVRDQGGR
ncbi:hypothetical protein ACNOYE_34765 [Nannocystaceae bacterium ST9]